MKIYLAGPMTGIPQFNFPAFDEVARQLRSLGHEVVSPSELDTSDTRAWALASKNGVPPGGVTPEGETWGDILARDVKLVADSDIDAVVVLKGWERSRGALLETFVAGSLLGLPVLSWPLLDVVSGAELAFAWCTPVVNLEQPTQILPDLMLAHHTHHKGYKNGVQ